MNLGLLRDEAITAEWSTWQEATVIATDAHDAATRRANNGNIDTQGHANVIQDEQTNAQNDAQAKNQDHKRVGFWRRMKNGRRKVLRSGKRSD